MTQTINPLAAHISQIARGLVDMDKRAGTFPAMREDTLHGAVFWNTLIPAMTAMPNIGTLQITHRPRAKQFTTITTDTGEVARVYGEDGHGFYDRCDVCDHVVDDMYLDANHECEDCVDKADREASERFMHGACDDTPSLDTSFHDHEMAC